MGETARKPADDERIKRSRDIVIRTSSDENELYNFKIIYGIEDVL